MSLKNLINTDMEIDGARYPFDTEARIKINQFYKLDLIERLRILKLAEETEKKFQDSKQAENTFALFTNEAAEKISKLENESANKKERNVFKEFNQFLNTIDLDRNLTIRGNTIVQVRGEIIEGVRRTFLDVGNRNYELNLISNGTLLHNGQFFNPNSNNNAGTSVEIVFEGALNIPLIENIENFGSDYGLVMEFNYGQYVHNKEYNFIYFKIEDNNNSEFNFMLHFNHSYCDTILCLKGKTVIKKFNFNNSADSFYVKIDDDSKKLYVTALNAMLNNIYIKNITIF